MKSQPDFGDSSWEDSFLNSGLGPEVGEGWGERKGGSGTGGIAT